MSNEEEDEEDNEFNLSVRVSNYALKISTSEEVEDPNERGSTSETFESFHYREMSENLSNRSNDSRENALRKWKDNYREAAIFLEEGVNNDKLNHHPRSQKALPAYLLVHSKVFNVVDLCASIGLLLLAFFETPTAKPFRALPPIVHGGIELISLTLIAFQVCLKSRWMGLDVFIRHKRTAIKACTLLFMVFESVVVMIRNSSHFRVTRALRPLFVIDNYFCWGVRRFIRQILQSLPPILDMLFLVFFVILLYSVFGFYLFSTVDPENFQTLIRSFISLFVLLSTANYPDVMMKSYNGNRLSSLFFISYLIINLYFLMNLLLAVVYDAFTKIEMDKFHRLYLHKRKAAVCAFKLLVTFNNAQEILFVHFKGLLQYYKKSASDTEAYLIFKHLNTSQSGTLSLEEFYGIYDACSLTWTRVQNTHEYNSNSKFRVFSRQIKRIVSSSWFEYGICFFVLLNGLFIIIQTYMMTTSNEQQNIYSPMVSYFFIGLYTLEACFKILGYGFPQYFVSGWNTFDFIMTLIGIFSLIFEFLGVPLHYIIILRPLRLLTLFRYKKRYRDVFGTALILFPRLGSALIVLSLIYYFFAIIGMEFFHDAKLLNCCLNTSVEQFYKYEKDSAANAYYYLNSFDSLLLSGVTLFELTVVNNWFIIMEGHAIVVSEWSRLFFMMFYIFTMIVMTIVVAFILEAFLFRIQYKHFLSKHDEYKNCSIQVNVFPEELRVLSSHFKSVQNTELSLESRSNELPSTPFQFFGHKSRSRTQLQTLMYADEIESWIAEARLEETIQEHR